MRTRKRKNGRRIVRISKRKREPVINSELSISNCGSRAKCGFGWMVLLLLLFGVSVAVRLPYLNRPLDGHHEWLTAQTLVIHSIWYERGIVACGFQPIVTFGLPADKNIIASMGKIASPTTGDYYYTSQPPLGYILPYLVLRLLGLRPDVLPLQVFNLAVHLVCVLLIFLIVRRLALHRGLRLPEIPALTGAAVYTFMPVALWFHGNVYSFEILVQVFFLLAIYLFLRVLERPARSAWLYVALAATAFCMSYTESLGVLFAFSIGLYTLFHFRDRTVRRAALAVAAGMTAALCLTFVQYSQIAGVEEFLRRATGTYLKRSGLSNALSLENSSLLNWKVWERVIRHYVNGFGLLPFVFAIAAFAIVCGKSIKDMAVRFGPMERAVVLLALLPTVLHHLVFFDFTAIHDYSVLKDTVFLSLLAGMLCYLLMLDGGQQILNGILAAAFVCSLLIGIGQFWKLNRESRDSFKETGEIMARTTKPDEVIFAVMEELCPQIVFYAHRNIAEYWGEQSARELIRKNGARRGIIFEIDEDGRCEEYRYIE